MPSMPMSFGGHALAHLRVVVRLAQYGQARVGVQVDEAGANDLARRVDDAGGVELRSLAAVYRDALVAHANGGVVAGDCRCRRQ